MKFCTKCGTEIKGQELFCTSCGNELRKRTTDKIESPKSFEETIAKAEPAEESNFAASKSEGNNISNLKLSKKTKIIIISVVIMIVAIFAVVQVGNSLNDPQKLVSRFEKDVASNNTSDLANILYCNDSRLKIDGKSIAPLLSYFKSHPSYLNKVIQNLNSDATSPKDIDNLSTTSSNTLTLANSGKMLFVFTNHKINIKPYFIDITTGVKGVTFSINNTEIGKSDTDKSSTKEFGPYIPGNYSILADYKGKYVTLNKAYPLDLVAASNGIAKLNVLDDMNYLNISSDYPDAKIFVNGKDANTLVKDAVNFGPVDSSAKIYATYVKDGKTLKTETSSASSGDTTLNLSFEQSESDLSNVQNELKDLLGYYTSSFTQAVNSGNNSLTDPYVASGSALNKDLQSYVPNTFTAGIQEYIISTNITDYKISDDTKSGSITTSEVYNITPKDGLSYNKTFNYVYTFKYDESTSSYQFTSNKAAK